MTQVSVVRGRRLIGGALCLDFVNTVAWRVSASAAGGAGARVGPKRLDRLTRFEDLLLFASAAGALAPVEVARLRRQAVRQPRGAGRTLARAVALREALHRILSAVVDGHVPDAADLGVLNRELAVARAHEHLVAARGAMAWRWDVVPALDRPLWPIARDGGALLTSPKHDRLRRCAGEACGWLFLDTTRNHSRQWCDMRDCGNLAKVRRFRARARRLARTTSRSAST